MQLFIDFKEDYNSFRREFLFNILVDFGIHVELVRLIQMCLTEICSRVWVGRHLSDMFTIKNGLKKGDFLLSLLFNFALGNAIRRVQGNQNDMKLNGRFGFC